MQLTIQELENLKKKRKAAQIKAIQVSKKFTIIKKVFYVIDTEYQNTINKYNKLDREYAFALFDKKTAKLKKSKAGKPYDSAKRTAAKALKALENLPKELRDKIINQAKEGLF